MGAQSFSDEFFSSLKFVLVIVAVVKVAVVKVAVAVVVIVVAVEISQANFHSVLMTFAKVINCTTNIAINYVYCG